MQKFYLGFVFLVLTTAHSQENDSTYSWIAKLNATQLTDVFNFPTVQLSAEKMISPKMSILVEAGIQLYSFRAKPDTLFYKPRGYKTSLEFRGYILKILNPRQFTAPGGLFIGIQPFYRYNKETFTIRYVYVGEKTYPLEGESAAFTDNFGVKRDVYGANFTVGYQKHIFDRWILESSIAAGFSYRNIRNIGRQYNLTEFESDNIHDVGGVEPSKLEEYTGSHYNLTTNFRIGYTF